MIQLFIMDKQNWVIAKLWKIHKSAFATTKPLRCEFHAKAIKLSRIFSPKTESKRANTNERTKEKTTITSTANDESLIVLNNPFYFKIVIMIEILCQILGSLSGNLVTYIKP